MMIDHCMAIDVYNDTITIDVCNDTITSAIIPPGGFIVEQVRSVPSKAATMDCFVNHGDIACLARDGIKLTKIVIPHKPVSFEVLCVRLRNQNSPAASVLSVIYRPASKPPNSKFFSEMLEHIELLASYSCTVYLTGDCNIHVQNSIDPFTVELSEIFNTFQLTQYVVEPKHELGGTSYLFITNDDLDVPDLVVTDVGISDHYLLTCSLNLSSAALKFVTRTSRNWQCFDVNTFRLEMATGLGAQNASSWDNNSLDNLVDIFDDTITSILDRLVPQRTKSFRVRPSTVWFDDDRRTAKRLTRLKERRYKSTGQSVDKPAWILQLRSYHRICDVKRCLFWKCQITSNSKNPKKLWN